MGVRPKNDVHFEKVPLQKLRVVKARLSLPPPKEELL